MTFPTEWKKQKKHVPNHQPVYDICLKCKAYRLDRGICLENKGYLFHPVNMASRQNSKFLMHSLFSGDSGDNVGFGSSKIRTAAFGYSQKSRPKSPIWDISDLEIRRRSSRGRGWANGDG